MNHDQLSHSEAPIPTPVEPRSGKQYSSGGNSRRKDIFSAFSSVFLFILFPAVIAIILTAFIVQSYQVDGQSMETSLQNHDRLIVDKLPRTWSRVTRHQYVPARGDIVIFNQTGLPDSFFQKQLIKRVIGLPGERVSISNGQVTVYNSSNTSGFNPDKQGKYIIAAPTTAGNRDWVIAEDEIFVLGDNRSNSEDSRYFGPVKTNAIVGKLLVRIYPFSNTKVF